MKQKNQFAAGEQYKKEVHTLKKNNILRAAALLLACCMFSLCTITGTMARYVNNYSGAAQLVRAGLFRVCVNDGGDWVPINGGTVNIDLYSTLLEANVTDKENDGAIGTTNDVNTGIKGIIAPGTGGEFTIEVKNESEVDVDVLIDIGSASTGGPSIEWLQTDGTTWDTAFPGGGASPTPIRLLYTAGPLGTTLETYTWRWAFDIDHDGLVADSVDTGLGVSGGSYSLPITIAAAQVLPTET